MSGVLRTTGAPNWLTNLSTLVSFTEGVDDIVPSSPYSPDVVIILSVIVGVIIFITVVGNLLVVAAFCTTPKLRTYNNYFILGLAIADLLVGAIDMPLFAIVIIMGRWPFGEVFCDIFTFLDHALTHISMLLVTLISLDRCVAVSAPFWHRQHWRRRSRAILIIAIGYIIPVIIWLPTTTLWQIINGNEQRPFPKDVCAPLYFQSVVAGFLVPVAYFVIPFVSTAVLCARIYIVIKKFYKGRKQLRLALGIMQPTTSVEPPNHLGTRERTTSLSVSTKTDDVGKEENAKDNKKKEIGTESMKAGLPQSHIAPLQRIQNTAARLVTRTKKSEHITPIIQSLHWLPIQERIVFKILLLVYKAIHNQAPSYLQNIISLRSSLASSASRRLRSHATAHLQLLPGPRTKTRYGDRSFTVIAPKLWNNLPIYIREAPTLESFKSLLKTHLFP
eukprot:XP_011663404.1 PREDICTED: muscarinic acetylcholine receptor M3-like [Strongylocentrotus purpuratus]